MFIVVDRQEGFSESSKDAKQAHATDTHLSAHAESPVYSLSSLPEDGKPQGAFTRLTPDLNLGGTPTLRGVVGPAWN